jgi:kynurenine formamidase
MVGIDALGLGRLQNHGAYDRFLVDRSVYIIENLTNLGSLDTNVFGVYCFPLSVRGLDALPARIVVNT